MPATPSDAQRRVPCPACGRPAPLARSNPHRPFCSLRCRSADFGAWASESYRVPAAESPDAIEPDDRTVPPAS